MSTKDCNKHKNKHKNGCLEADVVVIGGGAAGCILMNRLSKNGRFSVLGLEAGGNKTSDPEIEAVGLPAFLLPGTARYKFFWAGFQQTTAQNGLNGRMSDWTTGMLLGGGSSINGLYYGRGTNAVYSQWETISQSTNWSLSKILETFKSLENYHGLTVTAARGNKGPVSVLQTPTESQITSQRLLPACQNAFPNIPVVVDYNDPSVENCIDTRAQWFINVSGNKRVSSATAFLDSNVMTPDGYGVNGHMLRVLFNAVAVKINFDKSGRAKSVLYLRDGELVKVYVGKAVVLAGGINSSKLLQLSGIGPSNVLGSAGIEPVFVNENVGKHLQNHPLIFISLLANPADSGVPMGAPYSFTIGNVYLPVVGGGANDARMLQILFEYVPAGVGGSPAPLVIIGFDLLGPKSEGSVDVQSDNSFQIAAANPNFYSDPIDLKNMKDAVKVYMKALLEQLALVDPPFYKPIPGDSINGVIEGNYRDDVVEAYVKNNTNLSLDIHHFVSHCKMAGLSDGGVVDGDTLVYGTRNVYVGDNSICPVMPDINTTAPAMMIGLRCSEILKKKL